MPFLFLVIYAKNTATDKINPPNTYQSNEEIHINIDVAVIATNIIPMISTLLLLPLSFGKYFHKTVLIQV